MASILDICASSDTEDDVDYVPNGGAASDDHSSFDEEDASGDEDDHFLNGKETKITKKKSGEEAEIKSETSAKVDEKQRAKDLWESFLNDVESVTPKKNSHPALFCNGSLTTENQNARESGIKTPEIKPVCEVFQFAGETVAVDKGLNSCDSLSQETAAEKSNSEPVPHTTEKPPCMPKKRGIDSVLGAIMQKHKKLNVLEKTKIDWNTFKKDEGLDNELEKFNKGKQGFIERQRFLERSDLRSFEMEKSMRQTLRKK